MQPTTKSTTNVGTGSSSYKQHLRSDLPPYCHTEVQLKDGTTVLNNILDVDLARMERMLDHIDHIVESQNTKLPEGKQLSDLQKNAIKKICKQIFIIYRNSYQHDLPCSYIVEQMRCVRGAIINEVQKKQVDQLNDGEIGKLFTHADSTRRALRGNYLEGLRQPVEDYNFSKLFSSLRIPIESHLLSTFINNREYLKCFWQLTRISYDDRLIADESVYQVLQKCVIELYKQEIFNEAKFYNVAEITEFLLSSEFMQLSGEYKIEALDTFNSQLGEALELGPRRRCTNMLLQTSRIGTSGIDDIKDMMKKRTPPRYLVGAMLVGFSARELRFAGFTYIQIKDLFSPAALQAAGYDEAKSKLFQSLV